MANWLYQRRKKNLINHLQAQEDIGWTPFNCKKCKKEKHEYIDGNLPCIVDKCKYFGNLNNVQKGDLRSNLVGIEKFLEMARGITSLCPLDSQGYSTAPPSEIKSYGREVDVSEDMFFELMETYIYMINKMESDRRKRNKNG